MRTTDTTRTRLWPAILVAALALALSAALASNAAAYYYDGPALDTGLYQPLDDPGFDGGGPIYQPGVPNPPAPQSGGDASPSDAGPPSSPGPGPAGEAPTYELDESELSGYEPAVEPTTTTTTKTKEQARAETDAAIAEARRLLTNFSGCRDIVSGSNPADGINALALLDRLITEHAEGGKSRAEGGNGKFYDFHDITGIVNGKPVIATATGRGAAGHINLFKGFHREYTMSDHYFEYGDGDRKGQTDAMFAANGGPPTDLERRVSTLLHELAHLTGALPKNHGGSTAAEQSFDSLLFLHCVRGVPLIDDKKLFPQLVAPAGGGGNEGGFESLPSAPDGGPLPESDEPEIHFPEGDAPVLVLPDGQRIEEGEIGDPPGDDPGYGDDDGPYCGDYCGDDDGGWDGGWDGDGGGDGGGWDDGGWGGEDVPEPEAPNES